MSSPQSVNTGVCSFNVKKTRKEEKSLKTKTVVSHKKAALRVSVEMCSCYLTVNENILQPSSYFYHIQVQHAQCEALLHNSQWKSGTLL